MTLFTLLLRLFPRNFRDTFGAEMRRVFIDQRRAAARSGPAARGRFWIRTVRGMTMAAWREWRDARPATSYRLPLGETLLGDLRLTARMLVAKPLFSGIIIAALSLGLGGVATIFSGLNALVLRPLPGVTNGNELVLIDRRTPDYSEGVSSSVRFFDHLRASSRSMSDVAVWSRVPLTMVVDREAHSLSGNIVSSNYFKVLGIVPAVGRFFDNGTGRGLTDAGTIVLSHGTWVAQFRATPALSAGRSGSTAGPTRSSASHPPPFAASSPR